MARNNGPIVKYNTSVYRRFVLFRLKREGIELIGDLKPKSCPNKVLFREHLSLFSETAKISCRKYFETGKLERLQKEKLNKPEYVYVFVNTNFEVCKIGYSSNPIKRLDQIQTGCPFKLKRQLIMIGGAEKESELHKKYKDFRLEGEWFSFKGKLKDDILSRNL